MSHNPPHASPKHVGLIPDGGRRWARTHKKTYLQSYQLVMENVAEFVKFMFTQGATTLSIYLLSKENLRRPADELEPVIEAETYLLEHLLPPLANLLNIRIIHAGQTYPLPTQFAEALAKLCTNTASYRKHKLYLLIAYDPHDELAEACEHWDRQTEILPHLWVKEPLDLVIRTSGENRLSNFLPLQAGYAEYIFIPKHSAELLTDDISACLDEYNIRHRRFGR